MTKKDICSSVIYIFLSEINEFYDKDRLILLCNLAREIGLSFFNQHKVGKIELNMARSFGEFMIF